MSINEKQKKIETLKEKTIKTIITISATLLSFTIAVVLFFGNLSAQNIYEKFVPSGLSLGVFFLFLTIVTCFFTLAYGVNDYNYKVSMSLFLVSIFIVFISVFKTIGYESGFLPINKILDDFFTDLHNNSVTTSFGRSSYCIEGGSMVLLFLLPLMIFITYYKGRHKILKRWNKISTSFRFILIIFIFGIFLRYPFSSYCKEVAPCNSYWIKMPFYPNSELSEDQTAIEYCIYQCYDSSKIIYHNFTNVNVTETNLTNTNITGFNCNCDVRRCKY